MTYILQRIKSYSTRTLLIAFAVLLLVLNIGRFAINYYSDKKIEVTSKFDLLEKYRSAANTLPALKKRVEVLEKQQKENDTYFFAGKSGEEASSSMQLKLQENISSSGLVLETLRPSFKKESSEEKNIGEVQIKIRLSGSIDGFGRFISSIYESDKLFQIESFTLKPFKGSGLKIFLDLKGYYKIS